MKKIFTLAVLGLLLQTAAMAQSTYSYTQYETVFGRIDQTLNNFVAYSVLQERKEASPAAQQRFTALFAPGATLDDNLCAACQTTVSRNKTVDAWVSGLVGEYPKGLESVRLINSNIDYSGLDAGTVQAFLQRSIIATTAAKVPVTVTDVVQVSLKVDWQTLEVKIASVTWLGANPGAIVAAPKPTPITIPLAAPQPARPGNGVAGTQGRIDVVAPPLNIPMLLAPAGSDTAPMATTPIVTAVTTPVAPVVTTPVVIVTSPAPVVVAAPVVPAPVVPVEVREPVAPLPVITSPSAGVSITAPVSTPSIPREAVPAAPVINPTPDPLAVITQPAATPLPVAGTATPPTITPVPVPAAPVLEPTPAEPVVATTPTVAVVPEPVTAITKPEPAPVVAPRIPTPLSRDAYRKTSVWEDPMYVPHFYVSLGIRGGSLGGSPEMNDLLNSYDTRIAAQSRVGEASFKGGSSFGGDIQVAYYFGSKGQVGIGTGLMFLRQSADLQLNEFAVDYRSTDKNGNIFRQRITSAGPITEHLTMNNLSVPLLLKGRFQMTEKFFFTADAGLLFNLSNSSSYTTNAAFDYEAFYLFDATGTAVYDQGATPAPESWMISRSNYEAHGKDGQTLDQYFASFEGYNVGINKGAGQSGASQKFESVSLGFLIQPGIEYRMSNRLFLTAGIYYLSQSFSGNEGGGSYRVTDAVGSYNSLSGAITSLRLNSVGASLGLKVALH